MSNSKKRKLRAILFADIVGYTSLMQADESLALQKINRYQSLLDSAAQQFNGQVLKNYGDGSLMTFSNSLDAVKAAKQIQEQTKTGITVPLRIGIHVGEFVIEKGDIYGNGVNLAARIESLGIAGAVLFSKNIFQKIKNHPEFEVQSLGSFEFKNVEEPMEVFALANEGLVVPNSHQLKGKIKTKKNKWLIPSAAGLILLLVFFFQSNFFSKKNPLPEDISLGIIPFRNISGEDTYDQYGFGIASEIRTKLSLSKKFEHISSLQATSPYANANLAPQQIGGELGVDYLLMGMFQIAGNNIQINVELLDTKTGKSIEELPQYQNQFADIFQIQAEIANQVLRQLSMFNGDTQQPLEYTPNVIAYGHYLKGNEFLTSDWTSENWEKALDQFELAIQKDSGYLSPWVGIIIAKTNWLWTNPTLDSVLLQNVQTDMAYIETHFGESWEKNLARGFYQYQGLHNYEKGFEYFSKVLDENPENSDANIQIATIFKRQLKTEKALYHLSKARIQNPNNVLTWGEIGIVLLNQGNYEGAIEAFEIAHRMGYEDIDKFLFLMVETLCEMTLFEKELKGMYFQEFEYFNNYAQQNWKNCLAILDTTSNWVHPWKFSRDRLIYRKAEIYYLSGEQDSSKHYANQLLEFYKKNPNQIDPVVRAYAFSLLGNYDHPIHTDAFILEEEEDIWLNVEYLKFKVRNFVLQEKYELATQVIKDINTNFPSYGNYSIFNTDIIYNRIKKEHPPFVDALANLNLPKLVSFDAPLED